MLSSTWSNAGKRKGGMSIPSGKKKEGKNMKMKRNPHFF